jgi:hypothetical protein
MWLPSFLCLRHTLLVRYAVVSPKQGCADVLQTLCSSGGNWLEMATAYDGHMARVGSWEVDTEGTGGTTAQMETDPGVAASRVARSTNRGRRGAAAAPWIGKGGNEGARWQRQCCGLGRGSERARRRQCKRGLVGSRDGVRRKRKVEGEDERSGADLTVRTVREGDARAEQKADVGQTRGEAGRRAMKDASGFCLTSVLFRSRE